MSISCQTLYQDIVAEFGTSAGSSRLSQDFVRAVNHSLDQLSLTADLASRHGHITKNDSVVTSLDVEYSYILRAGVDYHLFRMGHKPADPRIATVAYKDTADRWREAQDDYVVAEDNEAQSDITASIIGLGYLGSDSS